MNDNRTQNRIFPWRRILAAVFACVLLTGLLPARAEGEALVQAVVVRDLKTHMTLTGTPYITYSLNGLECDSRYTGAKYNERAFQQMTKAQKNTVTSHF